LASIAAIAHVEMKTKQDQEELGTQIVVEGSKSQEVAVLPKEPHLRLKPVFQHPSSPQFLKVRYGRVSSYR
jgi:DNA mismatch repair protein MutL